MIVRHYSTTVSGNSNQDDDLVVRLRSEINETSDQNTGIWPEFTFCENTFYNKSESFHLNFMETDDAMEIEAELPGFGPTTWTFLVKLCR